MQFRLKTSSFHFIYCTSHNRVPETVVVPYSSRLPSKGSWKCGCAKRSYFFAYCRELYPFSGRLAQARVYSPLGTFRPPCFEDPSSVSICPSEQAIMFALSRNFRPGPSNFIFNHSFIIFYNFGFEVFQISGQSMQHCVFCFSKCRLIRSITTVN